MRCKLHERISPSGGSRTEPGLQDLDSHRAHEPSPHLPTREGWWEEGKVHREIQDDDSTMRMLTFRYHRTDRRH